MKNKNMIFMILAIICSLLLALPMFLTVFSYCVDGEVSSEFGLFADYSDIVNVFDLVNVKFASFWATLTMIFAIAALTAGVVYIVSALFGLMGGAKLWNDVKKFASVGLILCFFVLTISAILFCTSNSFELLGVKHGITMGIASYIMLPASLLAGIFGFLSCGKIKGGKRKKR